MRGGIGATGHSPELGASPAIGAFADMAGSEDIKRRHWQK